MSAVEFTQKNLDGKSSQHPNGFITKQKKWEKYNHLRRRKPSMGVANSLFHTVLHQKTGFGVNNGPISALRVSKEVLQRGLALGFIVVDITVHAQVGPLLPLKHFNL